MCAALPAAKSRAVLLDIEGTVCPIDFVYQVLFPYAREHLPQFVDDDWGSEAMVGSLALFREQAQADAEGAYPRFVPIAEDDAGAAAVRESLVANALTQMDMDRKTTALKSLQGRVWKEGFEGGALRSVIFDDVPDALETWRGAGVPVAIYSSGSIAAQKLFFAHTERGDLQPWISGYFDTTTGPKSAAASYTAIAEAMGHPPGDTLFATDVVTEAIAAHEAGMIVLMMDRPGNQPQPEHSFPVLQDFRGLVG